VVGIARVQVQAERFSLVVAISNSRQHEADLRSCIAAELYLLKLAAIESHDAFL
jgi:hypothetical protein